ncbi:MAG: N-formylglutamate amidohydrolase [Alphaproteobacteria bacterium]
MTRDSRRAGLSSSRAMDSSGDLAAGTAAGHRIERPAAAAGAAVFASPHSGRDYPADLLAATRLDPQSLRRSEDCFVDEIFADAPAAGAPLIRALFPRAYVDANREPYELDPAMFDGPLPDFCNTRSPRVMAGLGTIARIVATGSDIYARKLAVTEGLERIDRFYRPYHRDLAALLDERRARHGHAILIDCHSMPSIGGPHDFDSGRRRADMILGDAHGASCASALVETVARLLRGLGYRVSHNAPYAGGYTTQHYGRPEQGIHALQIEINRDIYMDERRFARKPGLARLAADMRLVIAGVIGLDARALAA